MIKFPMGPMIKAIREELGITMEDLIDISMDKSTLSRIEAGSNAPSQEKLEFILEKLGISLNSSSYLFLTTRMMECQELRDNLDKHLINCDIENAKKAIEELEKNENFKKTRINQQYLLAASASLSSILNENPLDIIEKLNEAMRCTHKNFNEQLIENAFLSKSEFRIILLIASQYSLLYEFRTCN